jgi:hypothetical protein
MEDYIDKQEQEQQTKGGSTMNNYFQGATSNNLTINNGTMTQNVLPQGQQASAQDQVASVEATTQDVAAAVRRCSALMYADAAMLVVFAVCRDVCHWSVTQSDFERMMTVEGLTCKPGTLGNALRNNPYMRDHITKWAALGARSEVIRLRDALCEAISSKPAT